MQVYEYIEVYCSNIIFKNNSGKLLVSITHCQLI